MTVTQEGTLESVTGGKKPSSKEEAKCAWDWVKDQFGTNNNKEEKTMTTEEKKTQQEAALDDSALEGVTGGVSQFNQTLQEDMARAKQQISAIQEDMAKATQQLGTAQENLSGIRQQLGLAQENLSGLTQKFSAKNDKGV